MKDFEKINKAYNSVFKPELLSIGLVVPIENYAQHAIPTMQDHLQRIKQVEQMGFKAIWLRDIPFHVPSFHDAGQTFDPFAYLSYLAAQTSEIALGISSIALPLHHPAHVAKSAATIDQLSQGRLLLGVASGDRYEEYPAMGIDYEKRGELFREAFHYIRKAQEAYPEHQSTHYGSLNGNIDLLPKAKTHKIPILMTGSSRQSLEWNAKNADGWMSYPRELLRQEMTIQEWRQLLEKNQTYNKPFMQPLYIDLQENDDFKPQAIHLGYRIGANYLIDYLHRLQEIGVNHIALNLRFNKMDIDKTLERLSQKLFGHFHTDKKQQAQA